MTEPSRAQHNHMHALWAVAGITDRDDRLALTGAFVGRHVTSSRQITTAEADRLIHYMRDLDHIGLLAARCRDWLADHQLERSAAS